MTTMPLRQHNRQMNNTNWTFILGPSLLILVFIWIQFMQTPTPNIVTTVTYTDQNGNVVPPALAKVYDDPSIKTTVYKGTDPVIDVRTNIQTKISEGQCITTFSLNILRITAIPGDLNEIKHKDAQTNEGKCDPEVAKGLIQKWLDANCKPELLSPNPIDLNRLACTITEQLLGTYPAAS